MLTILPGDYSHTTILMIVILYFIFSCYTTSSQIGSPSAMFGLLQEAAAKRPVAGNREGSYLTMKSNFGLIFGAIQVVACSGITFLDQAYWQRAIASRPTTAFRAYILGGFAWFAVPFGFATTLGLAAVALTDSPSFPTYPNPMTRQQISAGLAAPFAAIALLGTGGAVAILIVLFMAVTSCASAELIAVSSILTFDVYKTHYKPSATADRLVTISHIMICVYGLAMAIFAVIWEVIGIDLGWLFLVMGLLIGGAVAPACFAITWSRQTKAGAVSGSISGFVCGITAWLVTAHETYGMITVETTGMEYPTLAGNMAAVLIGLAVTVTVSLFRPDPVPYDWKSARAINTPDGSTGSNSLDGQKSYSPNREKEEQGTQQEEWLTESPTALRRTFKLACIVAPILTFSIAFLIPVPMFLSHYIFSLPFFTAWIVITFIWVFCSTAISVVLPIVEAAGFFKELAFEVSGSSRK